MAEESSRQKSGSETREGEAESSGIPLGINTNPSSERHQDGNKGAGVFNWRAGRGAV